MTTVRIQMAVLCSVLTLLGCHQSMMQTQPNQPLGIAVQPVRNESGWGGFEGPCHGRGGGTPREVGACLFPLPIGSGLR